MEEGVGTGRLPPDVRVDQKIIVVPEHGGVERGVVQFHLASGLGQQGPVVGQGGTDLGGKRVADALLVAPDRCNLALRVAEAEPHSHPARCALSEHLGDVRVGLREEGAGENEDADLLLGATE